MRLEPITISGKLLKPHKAVLSPDFRARTVLTESPWVFVDLWLRRQRKKRAIHFWTQAHEFSKAATGLPLESAPLLHYYSFMNAAKALLEAKGIAYEEMHGVTRQKQRLPSKVISLSNERVLIRSKGVLPSLSSYYQEKESQKTHSLQEIFFNLACIHRTYCLTYRSQTDMFLPLVHCRYQMDLENRCAYLTAETSRDYSVNRVKKRFPSSFRVLQEPGRKPIICSSISARFTRAKKPTSTDMANLKRLHAELRRSVHYICGPETLWYLKTCPSGPRRLDRQQPTLMLAAMHRLSELTRYKPIELTSFLSGQKNWLLTEFIQQSPVQFLDHISVEITGHGIMAPNVRPAV